MELTYDEQFILFKSILTMLTQKAGGTIELPFFGIKLIPGLAITIDDDKIKLSLKQEESESGYFIASDKIMEKNIHE